MVKRLSIAPQNSILIAIGWEYFVARTYKKYLPAILLEDISPKRGFGHGARYSFTPSRKFTACSLLALSLRGMSERLERRTILLITNDVLESRSTIETVDTCGHSGQPSRIYEHDMAIDTETFILRHSSYAQLNGASPL